MSDLFFDKLLQVEKNCYNAQDAVLIRLYLEGVEIHEIVYLKKKSLDPVNRTLTISETTGKKRQQMVSLKCVELYQKATNQQFYYIESQKEVLALRDSDFLIKASLTDFVANECMIQEMDSVILRTIYRRLRDLADLHSFQELTYLATGGRRLEQQMKLLS